MGKEEKKVSFSFSSKPSSSSRPHPPKRPLESSSSAAADADESKPQFLTVFDPSAAPAPPGPARPVIPPIPNSDFRRGAGTKRMKNLLPSPTSSPPPPETKFVLATNPTPEDPSSLSYGLTLRQSSNQEREAEAETEKDLTLRRFREDMKSLPDDRGMDEFDDVPIESFAAAVLAGYGWSEGKGIGRNAKGDAKPVQYDRRAGTEGLGYAPSADNPAHLTKRRGEVGFSVKKSNAKPLEKIPEKASVNADRKERRESRREENSNRSHRRDGPVRWLRSHIRVRVVSKDLKRGKLYLKKGEVVDVVGPTTCDISMDGSGDLVQGVDQEMLETALPKCGGSVLVLYGKHKGVYGSLVKRNAEEETGTVRDADSHALINVKLEQIAEYVGDPSYLGY
ncbi:protein MOS2 [Iris pallida]|uniref:Protein MOS2 n=1 Tax=Iris pallida TaxID=29817 RepID=A0AAX6I8A7_IRIPA|nr:protein MOS2 [Iris pallida]